MSYGRIRRGPMAADAFTQIRNAVFRDTRLSAKAMGIFGNISTHRDGWGITPESISAQMRDGVNAIKSGLRELEQYGYLQRERERRSDGTLGASSYFITDQPDVVVASEESGRSEPTDDFPPVDKPTVDEPPEAEPTVDDHPHKKTNSKHIRLEEDHPPSPPPAAAPLEEPPASDREGGREDAPLTSQEQAAADVLTRITATVPQLALGQREIARLAPLAVPWLERTTEARLAAALTAGLPAAVGSPAGIVRRRLLDKLPTALVPVQAARPGLPPWCGECGDGNPAARYNPRFRTTGIGLCDCHPDAAEHAHPVGA